MNWFLIANTILTLGAGIWFIINKQLQYGLLQLTFTISNAIFIWMSIKK